MYTVGQSVQIAVGTFENSPGVVLCGRPDLPAHLVAVRLIFWGHALDLELPVCQVRAAGGSDDAE